MACTVETPMMASLTDRLQIAKAIFGIVRPMLPQRLRIIDLACGHCLFLRLAASVFGESTVSGIDARLDRVPEDMPVRQGKVQDADLSSFDLILCLGIFYHLTLEDQLQLVAKFGEKIVIVDTHYGNAEVTLKAGSDQYCGSIYREGNKLTSSFGNPTSFWPTEPDLIKMLDRNHAVLKWLPEHHPGRSFYLMIPR